MTWHVDFLGRNPSTYTDLNFLWQDDIRPIYVMDNHRAASWCWRREQPTNTAFSLLHIDAHYDFSPLSDERWAATRPPNWPNIGIDEYLNLGRIEGDAFVHTFRWDNYLRHYCLEQEAVLRRLVFFTQKRGVADAASLFSGSDEPLFSEEDVWTLPNQLEDWAEEDGPWIVNLDLDVFFARIPMAHPRALVWSRLFSPRFETATFGALRRIIDSDAVVCTTVAISPECCGGWEAAEVILGEFSLAMGLPLVLPEDE